MEAEIRSFLAENFPLGEDPNSLPGDASLLEAGIIDSTGDPRGRRLSSRTRTAFAIQDDELLPGEPRLGRHGS